MDVIRALTEKFSRFPGIGPRQAKRFVYHLLTRSPSDIDEFVTLMQSLKGAISVCPSCYKFFTKRHDKSITCDICLSPNRSKDQLMIVCKDVDLESVEKSDSYDGYYFVLGGTVPILEKEPERKVRIKELFQIIENRTSSGLKEIIIATNFNPEGENTSDYILSRIKPLTEKFTLKVSTLGRGLSTGTELEYSDKETLRNALKNRV